MRATMMATMFENVRFGSYDEEGKQKGVVDVPHRLEVVEENDVLFVNLYNGKLFKR